MIDLKLFIEEVKADKLDLKKLDLNYSNSINSDSQILSYIKLYLRKSNNLTIDDTLASIIYAMFRNLYLVLDEKYTHIIEKIEESYMQDLEKSNY